MTAKHFMLMNHFTFIIFSSFSSACELYVMDNIRNDHSCVRMSILSNSD